uniref:Uncharacterized protein n=1 Tax=Oryza punctata TaxID=4537 RepID=A0A0E0KW38_ORYPU
MVRALAVTAGNGFAAVPTAPAAGWILVAFGFAAALAVVAIAVFGCADRPKERPKRKKDKRRRRDDDGDGAGRLECGQMEAREQRRFFRLRTGPLGLYQPLDQTVRLRLIELLQQEKVNRSIPARVTMVRALAVTSGNGFGAVPTAAPAAGWILAAFGFAAALAVVAIAVFGCADGPKDSRRRKKDKHRRRRREGGGGGDGPDGGDGGDAGGDGPDGGDGGDGGGGGGGGDQPRLQQEKVNRSIPARVTMVRALAVTSGNGFGAVPTAAPAAGWILAAFGFAAALAVVAIATAEEGRKISTAAAAGKVVVVATGRTGAMVVTPVATDRTGAMVVTAAAAAAVATSLARMHTAGITTMPTDMAEKMAADTTTTMDMAATTAAGTTITMDTAETMAEAGTTMVAMAETMAAAGTTTPVTMEQAADSAVAAAAAAAGVVVVGSDRAHLELGIGSKRHEMTISAKYSLCESSC